MHFLKIGVSNQIRNCLCLYNTNGMLLPRTTSKLIKTFRGSCTVKTLPNKYSLGINQGFCYRLTPVPKCIRTQNNFTQGLLNKNGPKSLVSSHFYSTNEDNKVEEKQTIFKRMKQLYRDYWYVLVPVHCATSLVWFGSCYYLAESGINIVGLLELIGVSEKLIDPFRNEGHLKAGYFALSLALYKILTPLRYAVTLGITTVTINSLKRTGYIKPMPGKEQIREICLEQKRLLMEKGQNLMDKKDQIKENVLQKKNSLIQKKNQIKENVLHPLKEVGEQGKPK